MENTDIDKISEPNAAAEGSFYDISLLEIKTR
jgi:hypothetical protein